MPKIASTTELQAELRQLLDYAESRRPSRAVIASTCQDLSERVMRKAAIAPFRWVPAQARDKDPVDPEGTDVTAWTYEAPDRNGRLTYYAIAFVGKQSKPIWHQSFGTREKDRDKAIHELIESRKNRMKVKQEEQTEKRNFVTDLFAGDVLYTSWGYDQTNVDWYEVIEVTGPQSVVIREIGSKVVDGDAFSEKVMPIPGRYVGPEMKKRVSQGNRIKITSFSSAYKWDGKPQHRSGPYGGH